MSSLFRDDNFFLALSFSKCISVEIVYNKNPLEKFYEANVFFNEFLTENFFSEFFSLGIECFIKNEKWFKKNYNWSKYQLR